MDPEPCLFVLESFHLMLFLQFAPLPIGVVLIILLSLSALISAAEVAFFSLSPTDSENLKKEDSPTSRLILQLKETPRKLLATILISNNFINIAIVILSEIFLRAIVSEDTFTHWALSIQNWGILNYLTTAALASALSFGITVVGVTFLLVLFGEVAPKIYANLNNVRHARLMATPLNIFLKLFSPFSYLLVKWSKRLEEKTYQRRLMTNVSKDKSEFDKAIELTVQDDQNKEEVDILKGIIKFGDVSAKQIMKARVDIVALDLNDGYKEVLATVRESGFSRIPVFEDDFDKIRGVLYSKDLLESTKEGDDFYWQQFMRKQTLFVPETKKIIDLLKEFQAKKTHMAIVVDEYGGSSGLVTLEDIMEEVVGDIRDEFDTEEEVDYIKIDENNFIFDGKTLLNDVARIIGVNQSLFEEGKGSAESLAGLILEIEGTLPKKEKIVEYKHLKFTVVSVNERRIEKVNVTK